MKTLHRDLLLLAIAVAVALLSLLSVGTADAAGPNRAEATTTVRVTTGEGRPHGPPRGRSPGIRNWKELS
jgi:hypothetical protein